MEAFIQYFSQNQEVTIGLLIVIASLAILAIISASQGREITIWGYKIGPKSTERINTQEKVHSDNNSAHEISAKALLEMARSLAPLLAGYAIIYYMEVVGRSMDIDEELGVDELLDIDGQSYLSILRSDLVAYAVNSALFSDKELRLEGTPFVVGHLIDGAINSGEYLETIIKILEELVGRPYLTKKPMQIRTAQSFIRHRTYRALERAIKDPVSTLEGSVDSGQYKVIYPKFIR